MGWAHLPAPRAAAVAHVLAGEDVGDILDLDQPVDVALVNGGSGLVPAWAVAGGVRSMDSVKAALPPTLLLAPRADGSFSIKEAGGQAVEHPCIVAPAAGPSPLRLVCGATDEALGYLAPYLTRTLPREGFEKDVHVELSTEPLKPFAKMMRLQAPALLESMLDLRKSQTPAFADLVEAVVGDVVDLVGDLGRTKIDLGLDPDGVMATYHVGFTSTTSLVAKLATAHPERVDAPPPQFWRLPGDSDTAFFSRGTDARELEHPRDLAVAALTSALGTEGLPDADQRAIVGAFHDVLSDAAVVYARGSDVVAMQRALVAFQAANAGPARDTAARAAIGPFIGWWLFGFDEPAARLLGLEKALVAAWNRPGMTKWLNGHLQGVPPPALRSLAAVGLPTGSSHLELSVYVRLEESATGDSGAGMGMAVARPRPPPAPIRLHALVVPDSQKTWLVIAADEKLALSKARGLLGTSAPSSPDARFGPAGVGTLATFAGLDSLRDGRQTGGGFTSLRGWVAMSPEPSLEGPRGKGGDPLGLLASLPSQGTTPIVFSVSSSPELAEDSAGALLGRIWVPRAAVEDIALFALRTEEK